MTSPEPTFDQRKLRQLTSAVMDGTATAAQQNQLTVLQRDSAAARDEYLLLVDLHATLATELAATASARGGVRPQNAVADSSVARVA